MDPSIRMQEPKQSVSGACELEYPGSVKPNSETYRRDQIEWNNSCISLILESAYFGLIWGVVLYLYNGYTQFFL